jgi:hypothetical protein
VRVVALAVVAAFVPTLAAAYDDSWHVANFWSGEYPGGFGVMADTVVTLSAEPDPDAAIVGECTLPADAVYHPWNHARVEADALAFRSYTLKQPYTVDRDTSVTVYTEPDWGAVPLSFSAGDVWTFLAYFAEGAFLMEVDGNQYIGDQTLFEVSTSDAPQDYAEWMRLTCPGDGVTGWLFLDEVKALPTIGEPNITGYPEAEDY